MNVRARLGNQEGSERSHVIHPGRQSADAQPQQITPQDFHPIQSRELVAGFRFTLAEDNGEDGHKVQRVIQFGIDLLGRIGSGGLKIKRSLHWE